MVGVGQEGRAAQLTRPCFERGGIGTKRARTAGVRLLLVGNAALRSRGL
jgi:hypothetical protein